MLLEKMLAVDAVRRAHQRHWPVVQMRQHPVGHVRVVARKISLGGAAGLFDDAIRVRDVHTCDAFRARGSLRFVAFGGLAVSRTMLRAGLSSRKPWNTACRTMPSRVHSANAISATRSGLTHCTSRASAPMGGLENGGASTVSPLSS